MDDKSRGETLPVQDKRRSPAQDRVQGGQERVPRAPHERDESAQSQESSEPTGKQIGKLGHDDVEAGRTDTDKGPVLDKTYEREFRKPD